MNVVVKLEGLQDRIAQSAIHNGLAKSKTEVLRMGLMELNTKYNLLEQLEDEEDVREVHRIEKAIREGKMKEHPGKDFEKLTGYKL